MKIWVLAVAVAVAVTGAMACAESTHDTAREWNNLGAKEYAAGNLKEAERMFRRAAEIATLDADKASICFNLAAIARTLGRYTEAAPEYREAIEIRQRLFGKTDSSLAGPLAGLALTSMGMGDLEQAETQARQAASVGPHQLMAEHALAQVLYVKGQLREAQKWGLAAFQSTAPNTVAHAEVCSTLAAINRQQGHSAKAEAYAGQASEILERILGSNHAATGAAWNNLAQAKMARGKSDEAIVLFSKSLATLRAAYGEEHPQTGMVAGNLALALAKRRRWSLAEPLFRQAIAIGGANDERITALLEGYAVALRNLENYSEAASVDARANGIRVRRALKEDAK